jgi:hypothetical protein
VLQSSPSRSRESLLGTQRFTGLMPAYPCHHAGASGRAARPSPPRIWPHAAPTSREGEERTLFNHRSRTIWRRAENPATRSSGNATPYFGIARGRPYRSHRAVRSRTGAARFSTLPNASHPPTSLSRRLHETPYKLSPSSPRETPSGLAAGSPPCSGSRTSHPCRFELVPFSESGHLRSEIPYRADGSTTFVHPPLSACLSGVGLKTNLEGVR